MHYAAAHRVTNCCKKTFFCKKQSYTIFLYNKMLAQKAINSKIQWTHEHENGNNLRLKCTILWYIDCSGEELFCLITNQKVLSPRKS